MTFFNRSTNNKIHVLNHVSMSIAEDNPILRRLGGDLGGL